MFLFPRLLSPWETLRNPKLIHRQLSGIPYELEVGDRVIDDGAYERVLCIYEGILCLQQVAALSPSRIE